MSNRTNNRVEAIITKMHTRPNWISIGKGEADTVFMRGRLGKTCSAFLLDSNFWNMMPKQKNKIQMKREMFSR